MRARAKLNNRHQQLEKPPYLLLLGKKIYYYEMIMFAKIQHHAMNGFNATCATHI